MKQVTSFLLLSLFLCSFSFASTTKIEAEALSSLFDMSKSEKLLTGTGTDVICTTPILFLDDNPIPSATYHASESVISQGSVAAGSNVTFKAGETITLNPGFHVVNQGDFLAIIEDCPASFDNATATEDLAKSRLQNLSTTPFASKQDLRVYPNPFSYTTTVDFQLLEAQKVHLAIYSATQQLVKVLAPNKTMAKGNYKYEFSGENLVGGMYFVVLRTEETSLTKKLILVK